MVDTITPNKLNIYRNTAYSNYLYLFATGYQTTKQVKEFYKKELNRELYQAQINCQLNVILEKGYINKKKNPSVRNEYTYFLKNNLLADLFIKHLRDRYNKEYKEKDNNRKRSLSNSLSDKLKRIYRSQINKARARFGKSNLKEYMYMKILKKPSKEFKEFLNILIINHIEEEIKTNKINLFNNNLENMFNELIFIFYKIYNTNQLVFSNTKKHKEITQLFRVCEKILGMGIDYKITNSISMFRHYLNN